MNKRLFATVATWRRVLWTTIWCVALVNWDLQVVSGRVRLAPALRMHASLYARRPDVHAIVHLHSHHVTVLSSLGTTLGMYGVEAVTLEAAARLHLDCLTHGGSEILRAEAEAGRKSFRPHYLANMWLANVDRVRTTDPKLCAGIGENRTG